MKILIAGEGGQGIQTIGEIMARAGFFDELNSTYIPNFGVEQRGGVSLAFVIISKSKIGFSKFKFADILAITASRANKRVRQYIGPKTKIINATKISGILKENEISAKSANLFVLGLIKQHLEILSSENIKKAIIEKLSAKVKNNNEIIKPFEIGMKYQFYSPAMNSGKKTRPIRAKDKQKIYIQYPDFCKGCGLCIEKCPTKALSWSEKNVGLYKTPMPKVDIEKCIVCRACEKICPDFAIQIKK